jgi:flagellar assembly protein FliH
MKKSSRRLEVAPQHIRAYRFPSLSRLQGGHNALTEQREHQQGFDQGFQQGLQDGHAEGLHQGLALGQQQGFDQGHAQGLAAGQQEGQRQGRQQFEAALLPIAALREQLAGLARQQLQEQQSLLVELVELVARRVIHAELTLQPQQLLHLVSEALSGLQGESVGVQIFLHPEDRQRLAALGYTECEGWPLEADPALAIGDCRVESPHSVAEALTEQRLSERMAVVRESILDSAGAAHE